MSNGEHHLGSVVTGIVLGALVGGSLGLGVCTLILDETLFFPGDTVLAGALICGSLGYFFGEEFIEWLKENWWHFW